MIAAYSASIARIHRGDGTAVGTGIVLDHRRVLTCAHVVNEALERDRFAVDPPRAHVTVSVPLRRGGERLFVTTVTAESWRGPVEAPAFGEPEDIAVLELDDGRTLPDDVAPARLHALDLSDDHDRPVRLTGFPAKDDRVRGFTNGVDVNGRIRIDPALRDRVVAGGFSGAGVWDDHTRGIVGMLVAKRTRGETTIAYGTPIDVIAKVVDGLRLTKLYRLPPLPRNPVTRDAFVRPLRELVLKGRTAGVTAQRSASREDPSQDFVIDPTPETLPPGLRSDQSKQIVYRDAIVTNLEALFAARSREGILITLAGPPGAGKSAVFQKLAFELTASANDETSRLAMLHLSLAKALRPLRALYLALRGPTNLVDCL